MDRPEPGAVRDDVPEKATDPRAGGVSIALLKVHDEFFSGFGRGH